MHKQPEITDATRAAFVEAFCILYREQPVEKITVRQLVERAGYSRATFYNYFHDVYEVLEVLEDDFISTVTEAITLNLQSGRPLEDLAVKIAGFLQQEQSYLSVFLGNADSSRFVDKLFRAALPVMSDAFGFHSETVGAFYLLKYHIAGMTSMLAQWLRSGQDVPLETIAVLTKGCLEDGLYRTILAQTPSAGGPFSG